MSFLRIFIAIAIISFASASIPAQSSAPNDAEKKKTSGESENTAYELLDQIGFDASALRLPENRAYVYATIAGKLWKVDEKRGRALFHASIAQIMGDGAGTGTAPDKTSGPAPEQRRQDILKLRRMILLSLAAWDGDMAIELLTASRPSGLTVTASPLPAAGLTAYGARQELELEQNIIRIAADQNPEKAASLIRESLSKGFSNEILGLVQKIAAKNPEIANKLLQEILQKMADYDYLERQRDLQTAVQFVANFSGVPGSPRAPWAAKLDVDERTIKVLAIRIADFLIKTEGYDNYNILSRMMPAFEQLIPEKITALKQRQSFFRNRQPAALRASAPGRPPFDSGAPVQSLIAGAANSQPAIRGAVYTQAVRNAIISGEAAKARSLLQNAPESKERDDAIAVLDSTIGEKALGEKKYSDVRALIEQMPDGSRKVAQIVKLAVAFYKGGSADDREQAVELMKRAARIAGDNPVTRDEFEGYVRVIAGYSVIEPDRAFAMLPTAIERANELLSAYATIDAYTGQDRFLRGGEISMIDADPEAFLGSAGEIGLLAKADLTGLNTLLNQFRRDDVRIMARLLVANGLLAATGPSAK